MSRRTVAMMDGKVRTTLAIIAMSLMTGVATTHSAPLHIVAVGDYHTQAYAGNALRQSFKTVGVAVTVTDIATETLNASDMAGNGTTPSLASRILSEEPDVVVFMLGTTDAQRNQFELFSQEFPKVLREIEAYAEGRDALTQLLVAANIPLPGDATTSQRLATTFNPWLREDATDNGWLFVDMEARLIDISRWQRLYADGTRLNAVGYDWMTVTIRNQIMELPFPDFVETPEPQSAGLFCLGLWLMARGRRRLGMVSSNR